MVTGQRGDGVVHVGDAEGEVVHHARLVKTGVGAGIEHVFEPVGAVGNLEADPVVDAIVFGAAVPVGPEAEDLLPERVLFARSVTIKPTWMMRVLVAKGEASAACDKLLGVSLDEDDEIALRVADAELAVLERNVRLDIVRFEVMLELDHVIGCEATAARRMLGCGGGGVVSTSIHCVWLTG